MCVITTFENAKIVPNCSKNEFLLLQAAPKNAFLLCQGVLQKLFAARTSLHFQSGASTMNLGILP